MCGLRLSALVGGTQIRRRLQKSRNSPPRQSLAPIQGNGLIDPEVCFCPAKWHKNDILFSGAPAPLLAYIRTPCSEKRKLIFSS
ncbi:hypothetical protein AVEN_104471-1 [Araneus ventricosus]|uniref:Uncharacterized protein n=1 Tax=Araneus ventricosus TaxID=182803 RepID=A0A4Y2V818_ARAVE|nr:hypothetical protein AVEN_104471-1 [Araneus ventricosus]